MRRPLLVLSLIVLAFAVAACATEAPGWTYAAPTPPPPSEAAPSGGASAAPSTAPSTAPSAAPSAAAPSESAGGGGAGTVIQVSAQNIAYDVSEISAPAGAGFTIHFDNKDAGIPHNVAIKDSSGTEVFKGDIITGPAQADYQVPALPAGTYTFVCSVHPNMTGTLTVGN